MGIKATNWSETTINASNWLGDRANETLTIGSPIGLLLTLTQAQSVDTPAVSYATDWDDTTLNATNWGSDEIFTQEIGLQNNDTLVLQTGGQLLVP